MIKRSQAARGGQAMGPGSPGHPPGEAQGWWEWCQEHIPLPPGSLLTPAPESCELQHPPGSGSLRGMAGPPGCGLCPAPGDCKPGAESPGAGDTIPQHILDQFLSDKCLAGLPALSPLPLSWHVVRAQ